jgi:hypothetical protein
MKQLGLGLNLSTKSGMTWRCRSITLRGSALSYADLP